MAEEGNPIGGELYICTSCFQLFRDHGEWHDHANGPFPDVMEAEKKRVTIGPGEQIPAGVRAASGECWYPHEELDPEAWTDIKQGDMVYNDEAERVIGIVGHKDANLVDVEPLEGGTVTIERGDFQPLGEYRAVRL